MLVDVAVGDVLVWLVLSQGVVCCGIGSASSRVERSNNRNNKDYIYRSQPARPWHQSNGG
jgi:hypothetical protein